MWEGGEGGMRREKGEGKKTKTERGKGGRTDEKRS